MPGLPAIPSLAVEIFQRKPQPWPVYNAIHYRPLRPDIGSGARRPGNAMTEDSSVKLVERWRQGDQAAAAELFRRYANRLIALARSRLTGKLAHRVDPEDVVQSVYRSFFSNVLDDRYELERGGDLWRLLVTMALHKVNDQVKRNRRGKRAVEREQSLTDADGPGDQFLAREPSPVEAVALTDELESFMQLLEPPERRVLELRLQGFNLEEIAAEIHRILERVKEKLEGQPHFGDRGA
jgi:RNA polymerase sigma-70 factor (ECF subfamily)